MPSVSGIISTTSGVVNTDVIITAYDVDLINQQRLGEITLQGSFSSQSFQIRYSSRQYQSAEGSGTADIQIRASTLDGLLAAETAIIFNAPDEVTDVRLELRPVENPASEFERLVASLTPLMENASPADLTSAQMAFLARDSRERRSRIFTWHEAALLTRDTGIPVEAGYGWWRRLGQPHTLAGLLDQDESLLRSTLVGAIRSNIIPPLTDDQIDNILAQLNGLRTRIIFGTFTFDPPSQDLIESNVIVQAFDRDFRSEELLGEVIVPGPFGLPGSSATGDYRIEYTDAQFQQNEARTADIIVRAQTEDALYTAESTTLFNAGPEERINLTLIATEPPEVETPDLSELEQLQADLEPIREKVPYANFTDDDLQFLAQELRQPNSRTDLATLEQRLNFLRIAAQHEQTIDVPLAAFYGWFRQSLSTDLAALLDIPNARLQTALETAIREAIIPDITAQFPDILDAIRAGRIEQGRLVNHRFVAQLVNAQTNQPLGNILADVTDLDADPDDQDSGTVTVDGQGLLVLDFVLPGDAPADASRHLQLTLRDEERTLATVEVDAVANQTEVIQIPVTIELTAEEQTPIRDLASPALTTRLSDLGIATIDDLLSNPALLEEEVDDELIRLRDRAKIAVLNPDLTEGQQTYLLDNGLASPQAIARISRAEFVERHRDGLGGDAAAYTLYQVNWDVVKAMHNQVASTWLEGVTSPGDEDDDDPTIPEGVRDIIEDQTNNCGCEDCTSAVSPAAYLAYLLDWMLIHIKSQGATVAFADFVDQFHQPFGDLPANCEAVTQEVRQVRLVVESLWRFIGWLDEPEEQLLTPFLNAYRPLRTQLCRAILTNLGVSFEQLRRAALTIEGEGLTADQVAAQRTAVANILGITESAVPVLFLNVDNHPDNSPPEETLEAMFGYENTRKSYPELFASRQRPQLISWQREQLESQWQVQDWTNDDYSGRPQIRLPYIDPALIDATYLRTPLEINPASTLLTERQALLTNHRQAMVERAASANLAGLDNLLARELSQSADQLQTWFAALQGEGDESVITAARDAIAALRLTPAGFSHLMEIRTTLANGESLGDTDAEVEAAWNSVFDILSRAHRHQQFPIWAEQENDDGIVFGPKLFWSSAEPLAINPWLASEGEQAAWLAALAHRSQPPLIDPDQIPQGWILTLRVAKDIQTSEEEQNDSNSFAYGFNLWAVETPLDAFTFWEQRRAFVDERISNLQNARQGAANPLDALGAMLTDSNTGLTLETLLELREQEAAGQDIVPRLAQFTLEPSAYRFLAEVHILAEADTSIPIHMWDSVKAILVQAEKQREFAEWRSQERNFRITLHPNQFQILSSPDQVADNVRSEWLYNPRLLNRWVATLEARKAQFEALETALANAVSTAEAQILPQLRNLLIFFDSDTPGDTLREKAEWTDKRLLMDMFMDGCHMTTRVSHAIETLQRLVRGVYTQEHIETLEELTLDAVEDYEAEWPVMGTYATWRAYMLAYLFPENLLHLTPHSRQSYGFKRFKNVLRGRPDTKQICKAVTDFSNYFRDVCTLDLQAACQVWARQDLGGECEHAESPMESILFIFGLAPSSNQVYTANLKNYASPVNPEKTLTSWEPIPEAYDVVEILGATPHQTHEQIRLILLFVKVKEASQNSLKFIPYDIDQHSWKKPVSLDLPPDGQVDFSAVVIQKFTPHISSSNPGQVPTIVGIRVLDGRIYNRSLNQEATNWVGEEWKPLFGRRLSAIYSGICAIVQRTLTEYMMILEQANGALSYRIFSEDPSGGRDDGSWRSIGSGRFSGAFKWPGVTPSTFVFYKSGNRTTYSAIQGASELRSEGLPIDTISTLSFWLAFISGVSLNDYQFQDFSTSFEFFGPGGGGFGESLGLSPTPPFTGTLVSLLNLPLENWDFEVPAESIGSTKESIFSRFKQRALDKFIDDLNFALDSENDIDNLLREWKIADDYSRKFTSNKKGITSVIQDVFDGNQITFLYRGSTDPITTISNLTLGPADISFAPVNSDESFGDSGYRSIVLTQPNGFFNNLQRSAGATFEALPSRKIVPTGSGPFDLSIVRDRQGLQVKRQEIETAYLNNQFYLVRSYLKEAYNLVPLLAGFELQRQGGFEEALLWFCQVYNYTEVTGKRKIDYGLKLEQSLSLDYDNAEEWLDDASNPHAVAATRKNTYTRHILLIVIRCLIDYADALFSRDNVTDNARARELYSQALKLLDLGVLKPKKSDCENILGELEVEIEQAGQLPLQQFYAVVAQISDPDRLRTTVDTLRSISWDTTRDVESRADVMRAAIVSGLSSIRSEAAELPSTKSLSTIVEQDKPQIYATLEARYLSNSPSRTQFRKINQQRKQTQITAIETITDTPQDIPWLRQARPGQENNSKLNIAVLKPDTVSRLTVLNQLRQVTPLQSLVAQQFGSYFINNGISFSFCIPQNPVISVLRRRAENNLTKLRTCRNIAGFLRQVDPYGAPIAIGSGLVSADENIFSGVIVAPPTLYTYSFLINRAKNIVNIAEKVEAAYQAALVSAENENLLIFQAEQELDVAAAQVTLQALNVQRNIQELTTIELQKQRAVFRQSMYSGLRLAGVIDMQNRLLQASRDSIRTGDRLGAAELGLGIANIVLGLTSGGTSLVSGVASTASFLIGDRKTQEEVQQLQVQLSLEERRHEWIVQHGLASLDAEIAEQQIQTTQVGIRIAQQERLIAGLKQSQAEDNLNYLRGKTFSEEMYRWIASVLEDVYRYFLQQAASIAGLAEQQLAFEEPQGGASKFIQSDYWNAPFNGSIQSDSIDRLGLTGSARLLKDIYQLDQHAVDTQQLKQSVSITLDLAELFPFEFQQFRETGVLVFETPQSLIDRQFPGYYLCLIQQITVSVVALTTYGIRASITSAGISQTIVGGDTFQTVTLRQLPERLALTSPTTSSGQILELQPDAQALQRPFEGTGFATQWELRMPKASNIFDYNTIATVLFTVDFTALHSFDYEQQIIERLDRNISANRTFRFRNEFADAWYDLNNPDLTNTPMVVRFQTRREDFPPNVSDLRLQHLILYFIRKDGETFEVPVRHLHFTEQNTVGTVGGSAQTIDGVISTRRGNGTSWLPMIGLAPFGEWELAFLDEPSDVLNGLRVRDLFEQELIEDMLLVITYEGKTPPYPGIG